MTNVQVEWHRSFLFKTLVYVHRWQHEPLIACGIFLFYWLFMKVRNFWKCVNIKNYGLRNKHWFWGLGCPRPRSGVVWPSPLNGWHIPPISHRSLTLSSGCITPPLTLVWGKPCPIYEVFVPILTLLFPFWD